jgi:hypothetical protein
MKGAVRGYRGLKAHSIVTRVVEETLRQFEISRRGAAVAGGGVEGTVTAVKDVGGGVEQTKYR